MYSYLHVEQSSKQEHNPLLQSLDILMLISSNCVAYYAALVTYHLHLL